MRKLLIVGVCLGGASFVMLGMNLSYPWLIASAGLATDLLRPPPRGRAPGWFAGLEVARRSGAYDGRHAEARAAPQAV